MRIGIDLVEVSRIEKSMKNPRFVTRVFGQSEQKLLTGANRFQRAAANFAVKEAFGKALGSGIRGFALCEVETLRRESGEPYLVLSGNAAQIVDRLGLRFTVSLTHTKEYASAVVAAEQDDLGRKEGKENFARFEKRKDETDADTDSGTDEACGEYSG